VTNIPPRATRCFLFANESAGRAFDRARDRNDELLEQRSGQRKRRHQHHRIAKRPDDDSEVARNQDGAVRAALVGVEADAALRIAPQIEPDHEADAADRSDRRKRRDVLVDKLTKFRRSARSVFERALGAEDFEARNGSSTSERISAVRVAVEERAVLRRFARESFVYVFGRKRGGEREIAA